jgi:hypothetical protein
MAEPKWPRYPIGSRDTVFAVGVIALVYNRLEIVFRMIFAAVLDMPDQKAGVIFYKIQNDARRQILEQTLKQRSLDRRLVDRISFFLDAFDMCANNRHWIMHSYSDPKPFSEHWGSDDDPLQLVKFSRKGHTLKCTATVADLRRVADDTQRLVNFGFALAGNIPEISSAILRNLDVTDTHCPICLQCQRSWTPYPRLNPPIGDSLAGLNHGRG